MALGINMLTFGHRLAGWLSFTRRWNEVDKHNFGMRVCVFAAARVADFSIVHSHSPYFTDWLQRLSGATLLPIAHNIGWSLSDGRPGILFAIIIHHPPSGIYLFDCCSESREIMHTGFRAIIKTKYVHISNNVCQRRSDTYKSMENAFIEIKNNNNNKTNSTIWCSSSVWWNLIVIANCEGIMEAQSALLHI